MEFPLHLDLVEEYDLFIEKTYEDGSSDLKTAPRKRI
jgi:hypothetical protein